MFAYLQMITVHLKSNTPPFRSGNESQVTEKYLSVDLRILDFANNAVISLKLAMNNVVFLNTYIV